MRSRLFGVCCLPAAAFASVLIGCRNETTAGPAPSPKTGTAHVPPPPYLRQPPTEESIAENRKRSEAVLARRIRAVEATKTATPRPK
ncbi:MAG: hypothetical protein SFU56_04980 [Capsulimonadales bacterium]|nr:hypothetical protein [Capsulimonadales bacterium]